ncbi:MAG: MGMT family protein [Anaeromyxobacter sp.]
MATTPAGWSEVYALVRRIPRGRVATYGQVAALLGRPRAARQVGFALAALRGTRHDVPWQRVLGARPGGHAAITILDPMGAAVQRHKLEDEGVAFDERGRIALERFGWARARRLTPAARGGKRGAAKGAQPRAVRGGPARGGARRRPPRSR